MAEPRHPQHSEDWLELETQPHRKHIKKHRRRSPESLSRLGTFQKNQIRQKLQRSKGQPPPRGSAVLFLDNPDNILYRENPVFLFMGWASLIVLFLSVCYLGFLSWREMFKTAGGFVSSQDSLAEAHSQSLPTQSSDSIFLNAPPHIQLEPHQIFTPGGDGYTQFNLRLVVQNANPRFRHQLNTILDGIEAQDPLTPGLAYARAVVALEVMKNRSEGQRWVEESLRRKEATLLAPALMAGFLYEHGYFEEGLNWIQKSLQESPSHPQILTRTSSFLRALGRPAEALELLEAALPASDNNPVVRAMWYLCHLEAGSFDTVRSAFEFQWNQEPYSPMWLWVRTVQFLTQNKLEEATQTFRRLQSVTPQNTQEAIMTDPIWIILGREPHLADWIQSARDSIFNSDTASSF